MPLITLAINGLCKSWNDLIAKVIIVLDNEYGVDKDVELEAGGYYKLRKETIERDFALAKKLHGFRYTQEYGQARMAWKAALTSACSNLKKLAGMAWSIPEISHILRTFLHYLHDFTSFLKTPPVLSCGRRLSTV